MRVIQTIVKMLFIVMMREIIMMVMVMIMMAMVMMVSRLYPFIKVNVRGEF